MARFGLIFGADTLAEVLATIPRQYRRSTKSVHNIPAKCKRRQEDPPEDRPEDPPPHEAARPSRHETSFISRPSSFMTGEQLDQRFGSTKAASLINQLYSVPCPTTGSTAPAFVEYRVPDDL